MKRLFLISDQHLGKTPLIDEELLKRLGRTDVKVAYIPSSDDVDRTYYKARSEYYKNMGITDFLYFDIHNNYSNEMESEIMNCDMIHLSGGDTQSFLKIIKELNFDKVLHNFVAQGKLLLGLSAGAIMMSENINIVGVTGDPLDCENSTSLNLLDFDLMPHWKFIREKFSIDLFLDYSSQTGKDVYLLHDGDGIFVQDDRLTFVGDIIKIKDGKVV